MIRRSRRAAGRGTAAGPYAQAPTDNVRRARSEGRPFVDVDGTTRAYCWCGRREVDVPTRDVRAGLTGTCGHRDCEPT